MNKEDPYYKTWHTYWKWRKESGKRVKKKVIITLVLFFPILFLVVKPLYLFFAKEWIYNFYLLLWSIAFIFSLSRSPRRMQLICPKCGQLFFDRGIKWNILHAGLHILTLTRHYYWWGDQYRCVHCGLEMQIIKISDDENAA
jgi:hypothetical protein